MMASATAGGRRRKSLTLRGVDPETCMIVFQNHWTQVVKILEKHEPGRGGISALGFLSGHGCGSGARPGSIPADEASAVQNYVEHMLFLLMEEEAGRGGAMGPILEFVLQEGVMERLFLWSLRRQFTEDMKLEQLRMYQMLLSQAHQPLLHHKPLLRPLMTLLASCGGGSGADCGSGVEAELVLLLNQLCTAVVKDPSVLELFFHTSEDQGAANFLLFSLLIPYTHRQGPVGQQAREALLLIMSLSASEPRVANHIAQNTYFCPVLATGLSGLYSSLPARLQVYSDDWHRLDRADWQQVPALVHFLHSLGFCSAVTSVTHPSIRSQLLNYIHDGFLVPVLAPALHKLTLEEVMTTTAYLDLFLRTISEPALLQTFLSFILLHSHDKVHILDTLVSRVNTPFQLGTVSLALFKTLIGLFCEDVMLQLVFRFLIACNHMSKKNWSSLKRKSWCSSSSASFLLLLPSWCPVQPSQTQEDIGWPKGADVSVAEGVGYWRGSDFLMEVNYLHYLSDARQAITTSYRACQHWSAPYDGRNPPLPQDRFGPGNATEGQLKSDSVDGSPTSRSMDVISKSNRLGRTSSGLELEWDDIFAEGEALSIGGPLTPLPPVPPPSHIQEMRRSTIKLVRGAYVEEAEFEEDFLVYNLVAQKDVEVGQKASGGGVSPATGGRTVHDTVNCIMSSRRISEDDQWRSTHEGIHVTDLAPETLNGPPILPNKDPASQLPNVPDSQSNTHDNGDFFSQYYELMRSLGAEPECENVPDGISDFRRRIQDLKRRLAQEDCQEGEEPGEETMDEQDGDQPSVPFTGPFISVLLSRLQNLLENSIAVNLLVTGILAQLASYPQPLLRSFLLCTQTHPGAGVCTLHQVLVSLGGQIERYIQARPEYPAMVTQAWRFLLAKDQDCKIRESLQSADPDYPLPNGSVGISLSAPRPGLLPPCPAIPPQDKSRVFAIVLYAEFLKELAAIALEHSIAPDWLSEE
ncbi:FHF complex subunit HOOK-interacting protein 1A-like [Stigmatopora nigra]